MKSNILKFSDVNANILIHGETGSGKELVARAVHFNNSTIKNKLVTVNCSAIPENLIESELFGTKAGAFTDARNRIGLFEQGHMGTIFLDEITELTLSAQAKLLRVIEYGFFTKVGDSVETKSNFKLITATNRNIKNEVKMGRFREDLYYRISPLIIMVPPLRARKDDIVDLSIHFFKLFESSKKLSPSALMKLLKHEWPGNIRELQQTILRSIVFSDKNPLIDSSHIVFH